MERQIIINSAPYETRAAVVEDRRAVEVFIERSRDRGITGNIYKGRVTRVLPGMQAAFVDIGLAKAVYLHSSDLYLAVADDLPGQEDVPLELVTDPKLGRRSRAASVPIEDRLRSGQDILVQVAKPPVGAKGARVTSMISLPGRHLVSTPSTRHIGVSRRIENEDERRRLKRIVEEENAEGGFIIRTACEGLAKREIQRDIRFLIKLWQRILERSAQASACTLLHHDIDLVLRVVRDLFTAETRRLMVDDANDFARIVDFVDAAMPRLKSRVQLYEESQPIFERFGIEPQIAKALDRRVWLKSGGYLIIDQAEALTTIDVNTGRFVGKRSQEQTILTTNLEAVKAIFEQLRLRGIGGLIVIDLIDMEESANQRRVFEALKELMRRDKATSRLLPLSELGLIEMTRKRTRTSLVETLCLPCRSCNADGRIKSAATIAYEILRRLRREAAVDPMTKQLCVEAHEDVVEFLQQHEGEYLRTFEKAIGRVVSIIPASGCKMTEYNVTSSHTLETGR